MAPACAVEAQVGHIPEASQLSGSPNLTTDEGSLAGHALPLAIFLNPNICKAAGQQTPCSHLGSINPGCDGNIAKLVNRHSAVAENLKVILFLSDVSQPFVFVHIASIVVREIKRLPQQHSQCLRIMILFRLIPCIFQRQNPFGFIIGLFSFLGSGGQTDRYQQDNAGDPPLNMGW
jgi:hypothetical protein